MVGKTLIEGRARIILRYSFAFLRAYNGEVRYLPVDVDPLKRQICVAG